MKSLYRVLLSLLVLAATLLLANCNGSYGCRVTFGSSTCTPSGSGIGSGGGGGTGGGGGGGGGVTAYAYAVNQNGAIGGYALNPTAGTFQLIPGFVGPPIPTNDLGVGMVVVNKQFLYTLFENGTDDGIYGWSINSKTGALTALGGFPMLLTLNLPMATFDYNVTTDPAGKYLFIADSGLNQILVYSIDGTTGALTAVGTPVSTVPIEPGNLTTDGLGRFLYVCDATTHSGAPEFAGYAIGSNGALTLIPGSPFQFSGAPVWQLQGDASGKYLVGTSGNTKSVSGFDDFHLYVFSINQTTGAVTQVSGSPVSTTFSPFTIAMQPPSSGGEFVYSFSINDTATGFNGIEAYQLNTTTGGLTAVNGSPFSGVFLGQWGQFDQSGANLLVYSEIVSGGVLTSGLGPLTVGASGGLTQPLSPVTLATPGYWVVTDP
jgi:6-phosphogluconolactonase (cycloisomerase 2 family)